jgi:hypothetical protein
MGRGLSRWAAAGVLMWVLAGCDFAPDPPQGPAVIGALPKQLCAQAAQSLDKAGKSGGFEHDGRGSATIQRDAWIVMGAKGQEQLTQTLAVDAACKADSAPREQQVFVRSEEGQSLSSRIVEIAPNADMFFDD